MLINIQVLVTEIVVLSVTNETEETFWTMECWKSGNMPQNSTGVIWAKCLGHYFLMPLKPLLFIERMELWNARQYSLIRLCNLLPLIIQFQYIIPSWREEFYWKGANCWLFHLEKRVMSCYLEISRAPFVCSVSQFANY